MGLWDDTIKKSTGTIPGSTGLFDGVKSPTLTFGEVNPLTSLPKTGMNGSTPEIVKPGTPNIDPVEIFNNILPGVAPTIESIRTQSIEPMRREINARLAAQDPNIYDKEGKIIGHDRKKQAENASNLVLGFLGGGENSIAERIAKSVDTKVIGGLLKKEIPGLTDDAVPVFSKIFKEIHDPQSVETALNRIKLKVSEGFDPELKGITGEVDLGTNKTGNVPQPQLPARAPVYAGETDLTTKILKDLEGKSTVSKQYILDATNRGDIKQTEKDIVRSVLESMPDKVPVSDFAAQVKEQLLPLNRVASNIFENNNGKKKYIGESFSPKYESISLPPTDRGEVRNYTENIYESPVQTSAGEIHFNNQPNYFGHTRIEDMADNTTRRVIEVQSDLYQKGNLENEYKNDIGTGSNRAGAIEEAAKNPDSYAAKQLAREKEVSKLQQYNDPTAHFRMVREEIKKAAEDGKSALQFPTGKTAMKIEGLGQGGDVWVEVKNGKRVDNELKPQDLKVGGEINRIGQGESWIITDVLGDGKFKALPKDTYDEFKNEKGYGTHDLREDSQNETFDISGKVDTSNPIYKFYEKDLGKYLQKFGVQRVTDGKGVSWYELPIHPSQATAVEAFKKTSKYYPFGRGPKVDIADVAELLKDIIPKDNIKLVFNPDLITEEGALGMFKTNSRMEALNPKLKPVIELYEKNGKAYVRTAFHEAYHYLEEKVFSKDFVAQLNTETLAKMTEADHVQYKKYDTPHERAAEYRADEFAKEQTSKRGYTSKIKVVLDRIREALKKMVDTIDKFIQERGGGDRGFVNFTGDMEAAPKKVGTAKIGDEEIDITKGGTMDIPVTKATVVESIPDVTPLASEHVSFVQQLAKEKVPALIKDLLTPRYPHISSRTLDVFAKSLSKFKGTDTISGMISNLAQLDSEIERNTRDGLRDLAGKIPDAVPFEEKPYMPKAMGDLMTAQERIAYLDTLTRNIKTPDEFALAQAEYDELFSKTNARVVLQYEELVIERRLLEDILSTNEAKELLKYRNRKEGTRDLQDIMDAARGTDSKNKTLDSTVQGLGFKDMEHAQEELDKYIAMRDRVNSIKGELKTLRPQVQLARILKNFLDDVPVVKDRGTLVTIDKIANTADVRGTYKEISGLEKEAKDAYRIFKKFFNTRFKEVETSILNPFDKSKGDMVDTINSLAKELEDNITNKYKISRSSKEDSLIREYGEGKIGWSDLTNTIGEERAKDIMAGDAWFRGWYDRLIDQSNEILAKIYPNNPEKLIAKHANYYRHIRPGTVMDNMLQAVANLFDTPGGIDPRLAGISEQTKPKSKFVAYAKRRIGERTTTTAIEGAIDYINAFAYLKHISPHIGTFRYLRRRLAEVAPTPGDAIDPGDFRENINSVNGKESGINHMLVFLDNYANDLSGKSHPLDRWISDTVPGGRPAMNLLNMVNNRVKANSILYNFSSMVAQLGHITEAIADTKQHFIPGMRRTLASIFTTNEPMDQSDFLKERRLQSLLNRFKVSWVDKPFTRAFDDGRDGGAWILQAFDDMGTNIVWNSEYEKALATGEDDPVKYADNKTRLIIGGRGIGEVPLGQKAKIFKFVAPYMLEVGNAVWYMQDLVKEKDYAGLVLLFIGAYLFNEGAEKIRGSRVVYDPINAFVEGLAMLQDEDNKGVGATKFVGRQIGEILSNIPLGQQFAASVSDQTVQSITQFVDSGGHFFGPGVPLTKQDVFGQGDPGRFGSGLNIWNAFSDPLFKFFAPFGGGQAKKTIAGIEAYIDGEVRDTKGKVSFAINQNAPNLIKAILFGKNATDDSQKFFDSRDELFRLIDNQKHNRDQVAIDAENKWAELKDIGKTEGSQAAKDRLKDIAKGNPDLAKQIITVIKDEKLGLNANDRLIKMLGVDNGERAKYLYESIKDLSKEEKKAKLKEWATKKIITVKVIQQIGVLSKEK